MGAPAPAEARVAGTMSAREGVARSVLHRLLAGDTHANVRDVVVKAIRPGRSARDGCRPLLVAASGNAT
eukprot:15438869-Alexandrium_andersonii.AAC.1